MLTVRPNISALGLALLVPACTIGTPRLHQLDEIPALRGRALKVHMRSGALVVLDAWLETDSGLVGSGARYGLDRVLVSFQGPFFIPPDSIALIETTAHSMSRAGPSITMMGVWTVLWSAITVACVADPKSCFGSCPTFYPEDGDQNRPAAEGFSASIARTLEARDVDALYGSRATGSRFGIRMTNEALETHAVRSLRLLVAPRAPGTRVFQGADGRFHPALGVRAPVRCTAADGDCLPALRAFDTVERRSPTDSTDLAARETLQLEFPAVQGPAGIVLAARQSLVSTYLFYQTIAYLGNRAGEWLAALERAGPEDARRATGMAEVLGGIDVEVEDQAGAWRSAGRFEEAGPIATDVVVLPLAEATSPIRVRLRMARGAWRLNWVGLATLGNPVVPVVLEPDLVRRGHGADADALHRLLDGDRYLVTYPGDEYRIEFALPDAMPDPELFLEAQGYYYEWMRGEWLAEENPTMAGLALLEPEAALRRLAPGFKRIESRMERLFWESRYGK